MPHVHLGALEAAKIFLAVILVGTIWRLTAGYFSDTSIGQAMAFMY